MSTGQKFANAASNPTKQRLIVKGRYHLGDEWFTRATTLAKTLADEYNLTQWKLRQVCHGLALRPDLVALAGTADPTTGDGKGTLSGVVRDALEVAGSSSGANMGTAIHKATDDIDSGVEPWSLGIETELDAYRTATEHLAAIWIEELIIVEELGVAGTVDRLYRVPGNELPVIGDVKTGQTVDFGGQDWSQQMAIYAHASHTWNRATGQKGPVPAIEQEWALLVHLPAGGDTCDLYRVDIAAGWEAVQHAAWVRKWNRRKDLLEPYTPAQHTAGPITLEALAATPTARRGVIADRLRQAQAAGYADKVAAAWPPNIPTLKSTDSHSVDELAYIEAVLDSVEANVGADFIPPAPPRTSTTAVTPAADPPEQTAGGHRTDTLPPVSSGGTERAEAMIPRLGALPPDLAQDVTDAAKQAGVPNLRTGKATDADLDLVEGLLGPAEAEAADRHALIVEVLLNAPDDAAAEVIALATGRDGVTTGALTALEAERLIALADGADADLWHLVQIDAFARIVAADRALDVLEAALGSKKAINAAAKTAAERHSLPTIRRSAADVAGDPLLASLTFAAGNTAGTK